MIDNAKTLAETLMAGGIKLASGGTDNHLMLLDVTSVGISGKIAEEALGKAEITVNKNMIPYDQRKPLDPSGIRIGTPALTMRGMSTGEMKNMGRILEILKNPTDEATAKRVARDVAALCESFPCLRHGFRRCRRIEVGGQRSEVRRGRISLPN